MIRTTSLPHALAGCSRPLVASDDRRYAEASRRRQRRIVSSRDKESHGPERHEFRAGSMTCRIALSPARRRWRVQVYTNGWPTKTTLRATRWTNRRRRSMGDRLPC